MAADLGARAKEKACKYQPWSSERSQQHLSVYQNLREQLENAAKTAEKTLYENVMKDYEEYANLVLEAAQLLEGPSSKV